MKLDWVRDSVCKSFIGADYEEGYTLDVWCNYSGSGIELGGHGTGGGYSKGLLSFDITTCGFDKILIECIERIADDYNRVESILNERRIILSTHHLLNVLMFEGVEGKKEQG